METRLPAERGRGRSVVRFGFVVLGATGIAACAAILGIDDRGPVDDNQGAGDSSSADGPTSDAPRNDAGLDGNDLADGTIPTPVCDPAACATSLGKCTDAGVCAFDCTGTNCPATTSINCPAGNDCLVTCGDGGCDRVRCGGGRSCTMDCSADMSCRNGISCQSDRCDVHCNGVQTCAGGKAITCQASVCVVNCGGAGACATGVTASATSYCGINCTGSPSCQQNGKTVSCGLSPDASIVCGMATNTCQNAKPECFGKNCAISCLDPTSCAQGYCCEAGVCSVNAPGRFNVCP